VIRRLLNWPSEVLARAPLSVYAKMSASFVTIAGLLVVVGAVGLAELDAVNRRAEDLVKIQRKIAAYRQLQQDTTAQLYSVASALLVPDERTLDATLRQLSQFGYDLDRLQFVANDEVEILERLRTDYEAFIVIVGEAIHTIRAGNVTEGREAQVARAGPLAERLERLTNELVNKAEADVLGRIDESQNVFRESRLIIIGFAVAALLLALGLGYSLSLSLINPVKQMGRRFDELAAGNFSRRIEVPNRDELGTLAASLNRTTADLGRLYGELEAASRHKSEFLANMSHELRTPLNAIIGFSEVLMQKMFGEVNEKQADYLKDIHDSGKHLLSLINDVLDLSKIEAGRMELDLSSVHVPTAISSAMMLIREGAQRRGIEPQQEIDTRLGDIQADERKLKQILLNLLSNAVKFTPEGGKVTVSAHLDTDKVRIAVRDSGVGISVEDQASLFQEFKQFGKDAARKAEGTGLGLALTKRFVALHGGTIQVTSAPGHGTTFSFTLPVRHGV
jgi:signal transduction histidine kinase